MIIADYDCGIDIESKDRDASMIKHKFLSNKDFEIGNDKKEILKIWCMKEVLYKVKKDQTILFNAHLSIQKKSNNFWVLSTSKIFIFMFFKKITNFENYFLLSTQIFSIINDKR